MTRAFPNRFLSRYNYLMSRTCVLFTSDYPCGNGEAFLENEIGFLTKSFDHVFIFAIHASGKESVRRVPDNCCYSALGVGRNTDVLALLYGTFASKKKYLQSVSNWKQRIYRDYCLGKCRLILKRARKRVGDIPGSGAIVVYSYWLNYICTAAADFASLLRDRFPKAKVALVARAHRHDLYWEAKSAGIIPFQERNIASCDAVYACSKQGEEYLCAKYPHLKGRIRYSYLGTLDRDIDASGLSAKSFLTICGFRAVKRMPFFAQTFVKFSKMNPDWRWVAIGDGEDLASCKRIIDEAGLNGRVEFLGSMANEKIFSEILRSRKVTYLVNTSSSEGLPVSMMEAASCHIPCIGTDVGGVAEIIEVGSGYLLPSSLSSEEFALALSEAASADEDHYSAMSEKAYQIWANRFFADNNYARWTQRLLFHVDEK